jgi:hypothetical protein
MVQKPNALWTIAQLSIHRPIALITRPFRRELRSFRTPHSRMLD